MDIPADIKVEIVEYLNVEYGTAQEYEKLKESDLKYEGIRMVDGKEVRYWKYPCTEKKGCWATVEPYEDSYLISMTTILPEE